MSSLITIAAHFPDDLVAFAPFVLAGLIVAFFVAKSIVEIISNARSKRDILRYHHEQSLAAYEKGLSPPELPAEVLKDLSSAKKHKKAKDLHGNLFFGVVLLIAALGMLYFNKGFSQFDRFEGIAVLFVVLFALGVGNLLLFFVRRKQAKKKEGNEKEGEIADV